MKKLLQRIFPAGLALAIVLFAASLSPAQAFFGLSVGIAPPPLPVYAQPDCPGVGYIWTPGYWAWSSWSNDYYWVPGTWVLAPEVGLLWTPGYWGCNDGAYFYNSGYWGNQVGFYGGINYGHGYFGRGYDGGYWRNGHFFYNRSVNNVSGVGAYAYSRSVADRGHGSHASFNGPGGVTARATADELAAEREHHVSPTSAQVAHINAAAGDRELRYGENHGHPAVLATVRPGEIHPSTASAEASHRTAAGSSFTGESHAAAKPEEHRTVASEESHHSASQGGLFHSLFSRPAAESHSPASHASALHEESHAPAFHAASHAPAVHAVSHAEAHAPAAAHAEAPRR